MTLNDAVNEIKSKDISELLTDQGLELNAQNKCCCPFHLEKTPSFVANDRLGIYKCFGCGESGDIFTYIQKTRGMNFIESVKLLCDKYNIKLDPLQYNGTQSDTNKQLVEFNSKFWSYCVDKFNSLPEDHPAKVEITKRGLPINSYEYGYYDGNMITDKNESKFLFENKIYPKVYANRLIVPLKDRFGRIVGFIGRAITPEYEKKYIHSANNSLFNKTHFLFNLNNIKRGGDLWVCEGTFDAIAIKTFESERVVATMGTAITEQQAIILDRMSGDNNIFLCLDSDEAGKKAMYHFFQSFPELHNKTFVVIMPSGCKDPGEMYEKHKSNEMMKLSICEYAIRYIKMKLASDNVDLSTPEGLQIAFDTYKNEFMKYIKLPVLYDEYKKKIEQQFGVAIEDKINVNQFKGINYNAIDCFKNALLYYIFNRDIITIDINDYPKPFHPMIEDIKNVDINEDIINALPNRKEAILKLMSEYNIEDDLPQSRVVDQYNFLVELGQNSL